MVLWVLVKYGLNLCVFTKHTYRMAHSKVLLFRRQKLAGYLPDCRENLFFSAVSGRRADEILIGHLLLYMRLSFSSGIAHRFYFIIQLLLVALQLAYLLGQHPCN
jgi:hypothetical protein